jgi:hypothetical protein
MPELKVMGISETHNNKTSAASIFLNGRHYYWAFPYGSGYSLQSFFAAGATQKKYFRCYP